MPPEDNSHTACDSEPGHGNGTDYTKTHRSKRQYLYLEFPRSTFLTAQHSRPSAFLFRMISPEFDGQDALRYRTCSYACLRLQTITCLRLSGQRPTCLAYIRGQ